MEYYMGKSLLRKPSYKPTTRHIDYIAANSSKSKRNAKRQISLPKKMNLNISLVPSLNGVPLGSVIGEEDHRTKLDRILNCPVYTLVLYVFHMLFDLDWCCEVYMLDLDCVQQQQVGANRTVATRRSVLYFKLHSVQQNYSFDSKELQQQQHLTDSLMSGLSVHFTRLKAFLQQTVWKFGFVQVGRRDRTAKNCIKFNSTDFQDFCLQVLFDFQEF
ncbi:hypothetical protein Ccrd_020044 [Cynara cardunculus var. scolymus]|uniref:Uncharacterized protein n=1 Tax=Cynara cardunculus var. scolymus TaxID=59895 RepID=A0A103Y375_CYNCS|nr:hypothetical protein Ccrd_020044 [Cynara cardunculus var. scolymus]